MNGKKTLSWLVLAAFALAAFGRPPSPRTDRNARVVFQFLMVVNRDGSAELHHNVKYSKEQIDQLLEKGDYPREEVCQETTSDLEKAFGAFAQEEHGDEIWCTYTISMDNLKGMRSHLTDEFNVTIDRLEIEDNTFYLDLTWRSYPCTTTDPSQFSCEWSVQAPGKVGENNATRVDGNTLTWVMSDPGTSKHFKAQSSVGGLDTTTLLIVAALLSCGCCTVVLLIAAGIAVFLLLRKRNPAAPESEPAAAEADPPPGAPPAPPPSI
jgi:hypothetical protein